MRAQVEPDPDTPRLDDLRAFDPDAWAQLYVAARPLLWRFARVRLATTEQAEDAVSETLVRAMSSIERFEGDGRAVLGWLVGIARNVVRETYRSGARQRAVTPAAEPRPPEPLDAVVATDEARAVRAAFRELVADDQELLGLRIVARLDAATTAQVLGKRPGAVRMAQSRALGRLRDRLEGGGR